MAISMLLANPIVPIGSAVRSLILCFLGIFLFSFSRIRLNPSRSCTTYPGKIEDIARIVLSRFFVCHFFLWNPSCDGLNFVFLEAASSICSISTCVDYYSEFFFLLVTWNFRELWRFVNVLELVLDFWLRGSFRSPSSGFA